METKGQEKMTNEKYVKSIREKQRRKFGNVELKKDCEYYNPERGGKWCMVCRLDHNLNSLPCEEGVCYFYSKKEEKR
jgi:hypothetical protein